MEEDKIFIEQIKDLFNSIPSERMQYMPSEYAEAFRTLTSDVSTMQGKFKYNLTPYLREIVDTLSPYHPAKIIAVMKAAQIGYALDLNTPIPTLSGWTTMGNIKVGDKIFDENGNVCNVTFATNIMNNHNCYEITFSDKTKIIADEHHKWKLWDDKYKRGKEQRVLYTKDLVDSYKYRKDLSRNRYAIDVAKPLQLSEQDLLIHPYVLGLWLGDGNRNSNRITSSIFDAAETSSYILQSGEPNIIDYESERGNTCTIVLKRKDSRYGDKVNYVRFGEKLVKLNLYKNKHIPEKYLRASINQRLELLQGLMDSDGSITKKGLCEFYSIDKRFIDQVYELICSLGMKATIRKRDNGKNIHKLYGDDRYTGKDIYIINFYAYAEKPVFKLKRKKERLNKEENTRHKEINRRRIIKIKKVDSVPVRCISVDSESHLFLAGKSMIPTHNTEGVIVNGILWIIANNPGNILSLSANDDLSKEMIESRLDQGIQSCGIQHLIRPNTIRKRNQRTGDTSKYKEYAGGRLFAGGLNSVDKLGKQRSIRYGFFDDWDAAPMSDKKQGSIYNLLQQRFASSANNMKQYYISTPETRPSNVEMIYLKGDQRKWMLPCPLCGERIELKWWDKESKSGIYFKKDKVGRLIEKSVGYVCPHCAGFFDESKKYEMNLNGIWTPTSEADEPGLLSYHITALTSAPHMYNWTHYVRQWLDIHKKGNENKSKLKVFTNLVLGQPWQERQVAIKSNRLKEKNTRKYQAGIVPTELSVQDGNGQIILLTCACDLNGTMDDARLDWEVVAHAVSGSQYRVNHGSIGTYQPGAKKENRQMWTYRNGAKDNVWDYFWNEIINIDYQRDDGNTMNIIMTAVDTGYYTHFAYAFIDEHPHQVIGVKGRVQDKFHKVSADVPIFKPARERPHLYILEVDLIKDRLAEMIELKWDKTTVQPGGFINFPMPNYQDNKFDIKYFSQYEAETKTIETDDSGNQIGWKWIRKHASAANHFFDVSVYNLAVRDIFASQLCKEMGVKSNNWADFASIIESQI